MTNPEHPATDLDVAGLREALQSLYTEVDEEVARAGPVCELSGRCCRFQEYGHTLFLSAVEAALLAADAPPPVRPLDAGETCPWQDARGACTARQARPLGCRVYFCDLAYQPTAHVLSERFLGLLKAIVNAHNLPWNYAPLHHHLDAFRRSGLVEFPSGPAEQPETSDRTRMSPEPQTLDHQIECTTGEGAAPEVSVGGQKKLLPVIGRRETDPLTRL